MIADQCSGGTTGSRIWNSRTTACPTRFGPSDGKHSKIQNDSGWDKQCCTVREVEVESSSNDSRRRAIFSKRLSLSVPLSLPRNNDRSSIIICKSGAATLGKSDNGVTVASNEKHCHSISFVLFILVTRAPCGKPMLFDRRGLERRWQVQQVPRSYKNIHTSWKRWVAGRGAVRVRPNFEGKWQGFGLVLQVRDQH